MNIMLPNQDHQGESSWPYLQLPESSAHMLREKVFNELYFKGYPKIPLQLIDEKLSESVA